MTAPKHTPGPWSCHGERPTEVWSPCGSIMVADCKPEPHDSEHREQAVANAKLIAAAPDLAEALEAAAKKCATLHGGKYREHNCGTCTRWLFALDKAGRLP